MRAKRGSKSKLTLVDVGGVGLLPGLGALLLLARGRGRLLAGLLLLSRSLSSWGLAGSGGGLRARRVRNGCDMRLATAEARFRDNSPSEQPWVPFRNAGLILSKVGCWTEMMRMEVDEYGCVAAAWLRKERNLNWKSHLPGGHKRFLKVCDSLLATTLPASFSDAGSSYQRANAGLWPKR